MMLARLSIFIPLLAGICLAAPLPEEGDQLLTPDEFRALEFARIQRGLQRETAALDEDQSDFDVTFYNLAIDLRDFSGRTIFAEVTIHATTAAGNFSEVHLDLCDNLTVDSILYLGNPVSFSHANNELIVTLPAALATGNSFAVTVYYHGTPCLNNGSNTFDYWSRSGIPTISTLSEPYGARDWWPCKDTPADKADSARIAITVADTLVATSNGLLESITPLPPSSHTYTWFERHPIPTYLICVNATNFAEWSDWYVNAVGDSLPLVHYVYPQFLTQSQQSWNILPDVLAMLESRFGEFPFHDEKYGHTMVRFNGGMEHTCNTSYGYQLTNGGHYYDWIVAHEAAHQYWGDDVTVHTWEDIWLNEGFASYGEALWYESSDGFMAYKDWMETGLSVIDPSGPVYDPGALFDPNTVYDKGGWILHILRGVLRNDSLFFAALREYRAQYSYSTATTADLFATLNDFLGFDIEAYVHTYIYRTNRPTFVASFGSGMLDGQPRTAVRIEQTQTDPDTTFRTRLELAFASPDTTVIVENSEREELYLFDFGFAPATFALDPDDWVLKNSATAALAPVILNTKLENGAELSPFVETLTAIGGTAPYNWQLISGALPAGLELSTDGNLNGTPTVYGDFAFTIEVTDDLGATHTHNFSLHIAGLPRIPQELTCWLTAPGEITLRWEAAPNTLHYEVYHSLTAGMESASMIGTTTDNLFVEPLRADETNFYYVTSVAQP